MSNVPEKGRTIPDQHPAQEAHTTDQDRQLLLYAPFDPSTIDPIIIVTRTIKLFACFSLALISTLRRTMSLRPVFYRISVLVKSTVPIKSSLQIQPTQSINGLDSQEHFTFGNSPTKIIRISSGRRNIKINNNDSTRTT
ncbi:hypothetical protein BGX33_002084, partial [Mortierella sp. NVP41]